MNGKGDKPRPVKVNYQTLSTNWQKAFGKPKSGAKVGSKK